MPRPKKRELPAVSATDIFNSCDSTVVLNAIGSVLSQGGAVMLGQTRDNSKLILTVYLDGEQDKEYCDDVKQVVDFLGQYQV